jgi:hypothetical protein
MIALGYLMVTGALAWLYGPWPLFASGLLLLALNVREP